VTDTGASCTGIILSTEQLEYSKKRYHDQLCSTQNKKIGDPGCMEFIYCDYRNVAKEFGEERFDRVVSVGMIEHVHIIRVEEYFNVLAQSLKRGGWMLIHGITNPNIHFDVHSNTCQNANFITKYIFPGGCTTPPNLWHHAAVDAGLVLMHEEHFGPNYAKTLKVMYDNLVRNWPKLKEKNRKYNETVYRLHEFYLTTCETVFRVMRVDLTQAVYYKDAKKGFHDDFNWLPKIKNVNQ